ncbi:MAG: DegV family protein [Actinomycetota bacterium]
MNTIAIVTDSTADVPDDLIKEYNIWIAPLYIHYNGKDYKDKIDIDNKQIYRLLEKNVEVKTSAPSPSDFLKIYSEIIEKEKINTIYSIHISSKLSNTVDSAKIAAKSFSGASIEVFDSQSVTMSLGLVVLEAARMSAGKKDPQSIKKAIKNMIDESLFLASVENFEYLLKGRRVSGLKRLLNMALKVRPVFVIDNGKVKVSKISRTRRSSIEQIAKDFNAMYSKKGKTKVAIFYGDDLDAAHTLNQLIKKDPELDIEEIIFTEITPVIGTHSGPSIIGLAAVRSLES